MHYLWPQNQETKYRIHAAATFLFTFYKIITLAKDAYFSKIDYYTQLGNLY